MAQIRIEDLHFTYPQQTKEALCGVDLSIGAGEYVVLCGESGCGKTTLLRHLKGSAVPHGTRSGRVTVCSAAPWDMDLRTETQTVGFVRQDAEAAVATDKVFHELAFGLENLGVSAAEMRLRTAEMAGFFGMEELFTRETATLSGGQLQLLSLASVLVMHPQILLLDEPTAQLDPVSAAAFLSAVDRLHRELGLTILLTEHRLEEVLPAADRAVVLREGRVIADCPPRKLGAVLADAAPALRESMPSSMRIAAAIQPADDLPLTVCEGKQWLSARFPSVRVTRMESSAPIVASAPAVRLRDVFFSYTKTDDPLLRGLSLDVPQGSVFALLGGNGAGKSTALSLAAGLLRPQRGKIEWNGRDVRRIPDPERYAHCAAVLPQQVQTLFCEKTARAELCAIDADNAQAVADQLHLSDLLDRHPFDLSGGEQQRLALGKVLLTQPKLLFLDEPTKGMDSAFKAEFADLLQSFKADGKTVFLVSHDVEFCAKHADVCAMLFDGVTASSAPAKAFFARNLFYTTAAHRMARHLFPDAVTDEEVIALCRANMS